MKIKPVILFGLAVVLLFAAAAYAVSIKVKTTDNSGIYTTRLIAGQHTDIGEVIVQADNTFLYVQYQIDLDNEYTLFNTHLWAGQDLAEMPVNRKGNPALGKFPYTATQLDTKSWVQQISLYSLGLTVEDICLEDAAVFFAAHATVTRRIDDLSSDTETAWAEGEPINPGGAWGMYDEVCLTCEHPCDGVDAWGFGQHDLPDSWGWIGELPYFDCPWRKQPIYLEDATFVGNIYYGYNRGRFEAHILMDFAYELKDANLYVGYDPPASSDPEKFNGDKIMVYSPQDAFGNGAVWRSPDVWDGDGLYVALHAIVCPRENDE